MDKKILLQELQFKAVRSSGAGGQHVNKTSSKVILQFNVFTSLGLSIEEKETLTKRLPHRLTKDSVLILFCDETRSQHQNKEIIIKRFFDLLVNNLRPIKVRRPTKPTRASIKKRVDTKKKNSMKKSLRKKPPIS